MLFRLVADTKAHCDVLLEYGAVRAIGLCLVDATSGDKVARSAIQALAHYAKRLVLFHSTVKF